MGLSFAASLASEGIRVALIDRQNLGDLQKPAFDGREIALTPASEHILRELGAWQHFQPDDISLLMAARVRNGIGRTALALQAMGQEAGAMVKLVSAMDFGINTAR